MSLDACADLLQRGDPDRFAAVMVAPHETRPVLLPIYAANLEIARAPWAASEPMIAEMRLQWWRDALDEIAEGNPVRRHEVTTPLADVLDAEGASLLDRLAAARRRDCYAEAFESEDAFQEYLDATGGGLMWAAGRALGGTDEAAFRRIGRASALANLFLAVPDLEARGRKPLYDGRVDCVRSLAENALSDLRLRRPEQGRAATLAAWRAPYILTTARREPAAVAEGRLGLSEFRRRLALLRAAFAR